VQSPCAIVAAAINLEEKQMSTATTETTAIPTGTWVLDPVHSNVGFAVKHMGVATVRGEFRSFEGTIEIGEGLEDSRAYGAVDVASVDTGQEQRDEHLRSADFFDAANHPQMRFESTRIDVVDEETLMIVGELEINGVAREIELRAEMLGTGEGAEGEQRLGLEVTGRVSRRDFGMRFNAALGSGNAVVADKVKLELDIAAVRDE
jgi:polyisoprenoid-binding protein YceI